ncbi:hypothetical protein LXL04_029829 [Taraxacum kok-saghyz]
MASTNPFDLLVDDDNDDPIQLLAKLPVAVPTTKKIPVGGAAAKPAAKLPSKPLPPAQAVRESRTDGQRGGGRLGGRGAGRGGRGGFNRESANDDNSFIPNNGFSGGYRPSENGDGDKATERRGPRMGNRGGRRGGYTNGDATEGERPRRVFERRSGTGRGNDLKREGAGRGNWGTAADDVAPETEEPVAETEKIVDSSEKQENGADATKENAVEVAEEKEPEEKKMTLEEYEKVLEEKRKGLSSLKSEERKVGLDEDLAKMQILSNKKNEEDIFVKLGSEKDKRKEAAEKEEKAKKSVSIDEFLKPAGRGRGRGRGGGVRGGYGGGARINNVAAPSIEDVAQFPSLSVK